MQNSNVLLATFMPKNTTEWFLRFLKNKFNIKKENVYVYEIENNDFEYVITYNLKKDGHINFKHYFENATPVNIKNGCIFSINALNKLIEIDSGLEKGNVDYQTYKIDWKKYKNKLLLLSKNNDLIIHNIKRIRINS
jgi:hypothetical protein